MAQGPQNDICRIFREFGTAQLLQTGQSTLLGVEVECLPMLEGLQQSGRQSWIEFVSCRDHVTNQSMTLAGRAVEFGEILHGKDTNNGPHSIGIGEVKTGMPGQDLDISY